MKNNRSIERCLLIFQKFRLNPRPTTSEIARLTDLPRATVLRFLHTLESGGYAARDNERWRLTSKVLEIGFAALDSANINRMVQDGLEELANRYSGTANIGELGENRMTIIGRAVASPQICQIHVSNLRVGSTISDESALFQATSKELPDGFAKRVYDDVNQVSLAVPLHVGKTRILSLGISSSNDILRDETTINSALEKLRADAQQIARIISIGPVF